MDSGLVHPYEDPAGDGGVFCKRCFGEGRTPPTTHWDTKSIRASSGERGCPRCGGAVFEAEKVVAGESVWFHKACFDCGYGKCYLNLASYEPILQPNF